MLPKNIKPKYIEEHIFRDDVLKAHTERHISE